MSADYQNITYEPKSSFAWLTLNRPAALNAIDPLMLEEIERAVRAAQADDKVAALILTGAGERSFCAGMDLRAFQERAGASTPMRLREARRGHPHPLAAIGQPVIAA